MASTPVATNGRNMVLEHVGGGHSSSQPRRNVQASKCITNSLHVLPTVTHRPHKLVVAHRGASSHMPEHSMPAYRLALELGADFIEPDIVATKDGKLISIHSVDLNITTNVAEVFIGREPWYSPYKQTSGYWAFNYTYHEISQLTVKQRLPAMRTTSLDGLFKVPLLEEILEMLIEWNQYELPQTMQTIMENTTHQQGQPALDLGGPATSDTLRKPSTLELAESGIYLELKEVLWQKEEAELDLVELMFEHFHTNSFLWNWLMPCYQELKYDTYKVPGLVIQSFELDAISKFHEKWRTSKDETEIPEPPYVVLADLERCESERFWLEIGKSFRQWISAVGPDKRCVIPKTRDTPTDQNQGEEKEDEVQETQTVKWAKEYNLALHPWTERPEKTFFSNAHTKFETAADETRYLLCDIGVEGIFSESVATAVSVATAGCGYEDPGFGATAQQMRQKIEPPYCYDSDREIGIYVGLSFFAIGAFTASLFFLLQNRFNRRNADDSTGPPSKFSVYHNDGEGGDDNQKSEKGWKETFMGLLRGPPESSARRRRAPRGTARYRDMEDTTDSQSGGLDLGSLPEESENGPSDLEREIERAERGRATRDKAFRAKLKRSDYEEEESGDDDEDSDDEDGDNESNGGESEDESDGEERVEIRANGKVVQRGSTKHGSADRDEDDGSSSSESG